MHVITKPVDQIDDVATGNKMRALRVAARLSLQSVGDMVGCSKGFLSDLELGRRTWTEARAQSITDAIAKLSTPKKKKGAK
jgi:transcriptional regulator with XRE-family HTH domain